VVLVRCNRVSKSILRKRERWTRKEKETGKYARGRYFFLFTFLLLEKAASVPIACTQK